MIKIGIDARAASNRNTGGLNRYTVNLIRGLANLDRDNLYILYTDRAFDDSSLVDAPNFSFKVVRPATRLLRENLTLPCRMWQHRLDIAHFPINAAPVVYPARYVITIHDTSTRDRSIWHGLGFRADIRLRYEAHLSPWFVRRATAVVTDSNHSKRTIVESLGVAEEKVKVVYPAAGIAPSLVPERHITQSTFTSLSGKGFILSLGSASPRKNIPRLIKAYVRLRKKYSLDHLLVIVTSDGATKEQLLHSRILEHCTDQIIVLPRVADTTLQALYRAADLFVCPSLYEGFGMPVLEAMAFGTPVVCSDRTSLPEVVGDAGLMVDPLDIQQMAQQMYRLLTDTGLRQRCISQGLQRCCEFSWEETARQMLAIYEEAVGV